MPPVDDYRPPWWLRNGHLASIYPSLGRRVPAPAYRRERLELPDGDFLDLDWAPAGPTPDGRLAILCHGLEGSSQRAYIRGMARALNAAGWDALAMNYRGCGGEPNRLPRAYHSGATEDLAAVVHHVTTGHPGWRLALVGFSLGGNLVLKYLGERGEAADPRIQAGVAFSVPTDLAASSRYLARRAARPYMRYFMRSISAKLEAKRHLLPEPLSRFDARQVARIRSFQEFDERFTAPLHGFTSAEDYWARCGSGRFLAGIRRPTLLVNARSDPFLPAECYPAPETHAGSSLQVETPRHGGHVGFTRPTRDGRYWSELRALAFLEAIGSTAAG